MIDRQAFNDWLENPATQVVLKAIGERAVFTSEMVRTRMLVRAYLTPEDQVQLALMKGEALAYELMSMLSFEDLQQSEPDKAGW